MSRKRLTFGFTTLAAVFALANAAQASNTFYGTSYIVVNGVDQSRAVGDKRGILRFCTTPPGTNVTPDPAGNVITFRATPTTGAGACNGKLPDYDEWLLTTVPGDWVVNPGSGNTSTSCMADRLGTPDQNPALVNITKPEVGLGYETVNGFIVAEAGAPAGTAQSVAHVFTTPGANMVCLSPQNGPRNGLAPAAAPMNKIFIV